MRKLKTTILILIVLFAIAIELSPQVKAWWNGSWSYRLKISIDNTAITETLYNFTVLTHLTSTEINWSLVDDNLQDIRFVDDDDLTELAFEVESYTINVEAYFWVKIPEIPASSNDFFYCYYGNAAASSGEDMRNAWNSNFRMVQHLEEPLTYGFTRNSSNPIFTIGAGAATGYAGNCPIVYCAEDTRMHIFMCDYPGFTSNPGYRSFYHFYANDINATWTGDALNPVETNFLRGGGGSSILHYENKTAMFASEVDLGIGASTEDRYWLVHVFGYTGGVSGKTECYLEYNVDLAGPWTYHSTILYCGGAGSWDAFWMGCDGFDLSFNGTYFNLIYEGADNSGTPVDCDIGYAYGTELDSLTKYTGNPIIARNSDYAAQYVGSGKMVKDGSNYVVVYTSAMTLSKDETLSYAIGDSLNTLVPYSGNPIAFYRDAWEDGGISDVEPYRNATTGWDFLFYEGEDLLVEDYDVGAMYCNNMLNTTDETFGRDSTSYYTDLLTAGPDYTASGRINGAWDFELANTDYAYRGDDSALDLANFTLSLWFNLESLASTAGNLELLLDKREFNQGDARSNYLIYLHNATDQIYTRFGNGAAYVELRSTTVTTAGNWFWVTVTMDDAANEFKLYVNGALENSTSTALTPYTTGTHNTILGSIYYAIMRYWLDGIEDEVRIENGARSAQWIRADFLSMTEAYLTFGGDYWMTVESTPTSVGFTLNGGAHTTTYTVFIANGSHTLVFPASFVRVGLTWTFAYWADNTSNINPTRVITENATATYEAVYSSTYQPIEFSDTEPVLAMPMNNVFELDGILEGNDTYRQMLLDTSSHENHAKLYPLTHPYAGPTLTWGRQGKALQFDGIDDCAIITNSASLNFSDAVTIEFWFLAYNVSGGKMVSKHSGGGTNGQWVIGLLNGKLYVELLTTSGTNFADTTSSATIQAGVFYHVALTYDFRDGFYTVYLGGAENFTVTTDGYKIQNANVNIYIGSLQNTTHWFNGAIDELRIYNYLRDSADIFNDLRNPIVRFDTFSFVNSGLKNASVAAWDIQEGISDANFQGFNNNDPDLPWVRCNDTYSFSLLRTIRYIAGFQQYQYYCNVTFDSDSNHGGNQIDTGVRWYWSFFRNGQLQVTFFMTLTPWVWNGTDITDWTVAFMRVTPYFAETTLQSQQFTVDTLFTGEPSTLPAIVSVWIGPDNRHFSMRFDLQDSRVATSGTFPFMYSFDLVDANLNVHTVDWFDGWIVAGIRTLVRKQDAGHWYRLEISSHKLFWLIPVIVVGIIIGIPVLYAMITGQGNVVTEVITTISREVYNVLKPIGEAVGAAVKGMADAVGNAIAGLSHDILAGLGNLGNVFGQMLKPLTDMLWNLGTSVINAAISFMNPILGAIISGAVALWELIRNGLDSILEALFHQPSMFTNFVNLVLTSITNFVTWIGYAGTGLSSVATMLTQFFTVLANFLSGILNFWAWVIATVTNPLLQAITIMGDWWNATGMFTGSVAGSTLTYIVALLYLVYIFAKCADEQSFEPLFKTIQWGLVFFTFLFNTIWWFVSGLVTLANFVRHVLPKILGTG